MDWKTRILLKALDRDGCHVCNTKENLRLCTGTIGIEKADLLNIDVFCRQHHLEIHQKMGTVPEEDITGDGIFDASLAQNGQVTLKKSVRDALGINPSDIVILQVLRVISPSGFVKWDSEKEV